MVACGAGSIVGRRCARARAAHRGPLRRGQRPRANGIIELSPFEFLDRLAELVPPPRSHWHRYHGAFAPHHNLRRALTAVAIGNVGKRVDAATGGYASDGRATGGCCDANQKPRSHDTSRIAWAKLMARVGEEFPMQCPGCGGDIRLIAFITEPGPIRNSSRTSANRLNLHFLLWSEVARCEYSTFCGESYGE